MKVRESLEIINFKVGKLDDFAGKAINPIVSNRVIVYELNTQLQSYANITRGINDVHTFPLQSNTPFVEAPKFALRSEPYYYIYVLNKGTIFSMDMRNQRDIYPIFRYNPQYGITNWVMPWASGNKQFLSFFPMNNVSALETTLTGNISATDTTIPVVSTSAYVSNHGWISIGDEKILYGRKDTTNFYNCERGNQATIAVSHETGATVTENNIVIFYSKIPQPIVVRDDEFIEKEVLARELEVTEEHMEGINKAVAYNILIKLDPTRSLVYKMDYEALYRQYKHDIAKGYYRGRGGTGIRSPYAMNEAGIPFGPNFVGY
jgi:hypothetical protein